MKQDFSNFMYGRFNHRHFQKDVQEGAKIIANTVFPVGNESPVFKVGDVVRASSISRGLKEGTLVTVTQIDINRGFVRYFGAGQWHRAEELVA